MKSLLHIGRMNRFEDGEDVQYYSLGDKWITTCAPQDPCADLKKPDPATWTEPADCYNCSNRGLIDGSSQESHCEHCIHGDGWRTEHYRTKDVK